MNRQRGLLPDVDEHAIRIAAPRELVWRALQLTLAGRHRFSRCMLTFELTDITDGATQLRAKTYARFPGVHGQVHRALVIGTRAHLVATNHMLRSVRRLSLEST